MSRGVNEDENRVRGRLLRRGYRLEILTVAWNALEGIVALAAGTAAGSVALVGFGVDSFVESASAIVVGRRFRAELQGSPGTDPERVEHAAARVAGILLLLLAAYIVVDAGRRLLGFGEEAQESRLGVAVTAVSLVVMPLLAWVKLRVAEALPSKALRADAYETVTCAWLSVTTLGGLALNLWLGWSWADPAAALLLVPLIVREGLEGLEYWENEAEDGGLHNEPPG